jgi:hypothetical protein
VDRREMIETVAAQYDLFLRKCGVRPDFLDGHLHVHQLPRVASAVEAFVLSLPAESRPYVRNTHLPLSELRSRRLPWLKAGFIETFGRPMLQRLSHAGIRTNRGFAGIYDFKKFREYPAYLPRFLECLPNPNGILVVHPGCGEDWREQELKTLREFEFSPGILNRFERLPSGNGLRAKCHAQCF